MSDSSFLSRNFENWFVKRAPRRLGALLVRARTEWWGWGADDAVPVRTGACMAESADPINGMVYPINGP
jgi:hypothetical protein